ncbi:hypothetical protein [Candidatus Accumulibacter vicinus]|nr:hypothetical protein [Candidatus Accumulibacter vicinus]
MLRPENRQQLAEISEGGMLRKGRSIFGEQPATFGSSTPAPPPTTATSLGGDPETRTFGKTPTGGPVTVGITDKTPRAGIPAGEPGDLLRGNVDAYGNRTAVTQQLKGELAGVLAEKAAAQADFDAKYAGRPTYAQQQQQDADRFTRFVNESNTARLAHDLGTGGGNAQSNAGRIAALNAMQQRDATMREDATRQQGQLLKAAGDSGQQAVLSKGQLLQHNTAMAQIIGSPLHQQGQLLDAALKSGQVSQAKAMQDLQAQLLAAGKAGDTNKQAQLALLLRQFAGKDAQEGKLISVGGGQEIDPNTGMVRTLPSQAVYVVPGQEPRVISANAKPAPSQADLEHTAKVHGLTVEQVKARLQEKK